MKKTSINNAIKFLPIFVVILIVANCESSGETKSIPDISEDISLSEFMLGKWKYEGEYYFEGYGYSDIYWEYTFVDDKVIKIWTGNDGGICSYEFIEENLISIDCNPRMQELMIWSIRRDGQYLLIQRMDEEELRFKRFTETY